MTSGRLQAACKLLASSKAANFRQIIMDHLSASLSSDEMPEDISSLMTATRSQAYADDTVLYELLVRAMVSSVGCCSNAASWSSAVATCMCDALKILVARPYSPDVIVVALRFVFRLCDAGMRSSMFDCCAIVPRFLRHQCAEVQEAAATCVHVMCVGSLAVESFICANGCLELGSLLHSSNNSVVAACVHALHALSQDINFAREICDCGVVPTLSQLLLKGSPSIVSAAAGTLQNVGREKSSCDVLLACGVVDAISPLLFAPDSTLQAAGVGVLLNLHSGSDESRKALVEVLKTVIAAQALEECSLLQ